MSLECNSHFCISKTIVCGIEQKIEDPLSDEVLAGAYQPGHTVLVDLSADDDELIIRPQVEEATANS